jgi:hypothetical protein
MDTDFGAFIELESDTETLMKNKETSSVRIDKFQYVRKKVDIYI